MTVAVEFFKWWIVDQVTGEPRLTTFKLSRVNAELAFPGAKPDFESREVRNLPHPDKVAPTDGRIND